MELIDLFEQMLRDEVIDAKEKLEAAIVSAQAELASLRAFKAACEGQKPVAVVTDVYGLVWYGSGPIAPIVRRNNIKVGAPLYANPDPEAAQLRMRIADLERQLANERASAIHTCGPNCQRPGCVEHRERDQRVAEACRGERI